MSHSVNLLEHQFQILDLGEWGKEIQERRRLKNKTKRQRRKERKK